MFIFNNKKQRTSRCDNCVFCKVVKKKSGRIIYEDSEILAFYTLHPQAPVHFLVIPKKHIDMVQNISSKDSKILGKMMYVCSMIAKNIPELQDGYRMVMNNGENARQEIYHIHLHVVGGVRLIPSKYVRHVFTKSNSTETNSDGSSETHDDSAEA